MQKEGFLHDWLEANSGTMVPRKFWIWSGLSVLAMTLGRKVFVDHQHFKVYPNLYITLVGRQGMRKTTPKDKAQDILLKANPDYPTGASVTSREQIVARMSSDDMMKVFRNEANELIEWRPMAFFVNELKNFMSIDPAKMVEFLTDIYDRPLFKADTIKHGLQPIINPCVNILACETPEWIIDKLRQNILSGGFARRMFFIYETVKMPRIPFPIKTPEAYAAEERCVEHLKKIETLVGSFTWTSEAKEKFAKWFIGLPYQEDPVLEGFYEAKDILATKIAMLLAASKPNPSLEFDWPTMELAIAIIESIEPNLAKLTLAVGRNDLAVIQQRLLQIIVDRGGMMPEREWRIIATKDMKQSDYNEVKKFLIETDQIKVQIFDNLPLKLQVLTIAKYDELVEKGAIRSMPSPAVT